MFVDRNTEIHLERIEPDRNCWRWYALSVEPTLFGDWALVRSWGRIGNHRGQRLNKFYDDREAACAAMHESQLAKARRGYVFCSTGQDLPRASKPAPETSS